MLDIVLKNHIFLILVPFGSITLLAGVTMKIFPPKKINSFYGYRTINSMKNQANWDFAQVFFGKLAIKIGLINICIGFIGMIYQPKEVISIAGSLFIMIISIITLIIKVELALKYKNQ